MGGLIVPEFDSCLCLRFPSIRVSRGTGWRRR